MWTVIVIIAIAVVLFSAWQHKWNPVKAMVEFAVGIVPDNPQTLADDAGVDLEVYSLARVGQSEQGISSDRAKIAVMYAAKNHARHQGKSITDIVTKGNSKRSDYAQANGHYGRQGIHPYCSTIAAPTKHTLILADTVYSGDAQDETQDAQWFDDPITQDALALAHPKDPATGKGYYTSAQIAERRIAKGATMVTIDGITTRFWA
jgi:hypothetical protein